MEIGITNTEFRDRSQTAPILLRRHRERNNMTIEHKDNNNTEGNVLHLKQNGCLILNMNLDIGGRIG